MQLTDSVRNFAKLVLYVALIVLPGGCVGLLFLWWLSRRQGKPMTLPVSIRPWVYGLLPAALAAKLT